MELVPVANVLVGSATPAPLTSAGSAEIPSQNAQVVDFPQVMQQVGLGPQAASPLGGVVTNSASIEFPRDTLVEDPAAEKDLPTTGQTLPSESLAALPIEPFGLSMAKGFVASADSSELTYRVFLPMDSVDLKTLSGEISSAETGKQRSASSLLLAGGQLSGSFDDSPSEKNFSDARGFDTKQYLLNSLLNSDGNSTGEPVDLLSVLKATSTVSEFQDSSSGIRGVDASSLFGAIDPVRSLGGSGSALQTRDGLLMSTPLGQQGWGDELYSKIQWISKQEVQTANLRLNPANLGPIEVRVSIMQDHATVSFVSGHSSVRDAIELSAPRLRELLAENGILSVEVNVSAHSQANGQGRYTEKSGLPNPAYDTLNVSSPEKLENLDNLPSRKHWNGHHIDFFA